MTAAFGPTAKVLIIEDNAHYAEKLARAFRSSHRGLTFDVKIVTSEFEAERFITENEIDIYVVDLELPELNAAPSEEVGERLVKRIVDVTDGGVIINTGMLRTDREDFLYGGVDDYIPKIAPITEIPAKAFAVWSRVQKAQKPRAVTKKHTRTFKIGKWRFQDGNRSLISDRGETVRLSATELAFVKYLCTVDTEIDRREFNVAVLGREEYEEDKRIDNLVYRLREKLGDTFQLVSRHGGGTYKLISFEELPRE